MNEMKKEIKKEQEIENKIKKEHEMEREIERTVEGEIIIELKAVQHLLPIHETQLVNYLTATNTDHGLLINFGGERIEIKRKFREYKHKNYA